MLYLGQDQLILFSALFANQMATKEPIDIRSGKFIYWMDKDPAKYQQLDKSIESKKKYK